MKDEMPFAVRMDVEGAVQLVDPRAAELAVDGRDGPAHLCSSSPICRVIYDKVQQLERIPKSKVGASCPPAPRRVSTSCTPDLSGSAARSWRTRLSGSPASGG